jgi:hypothetical protein
LAIRAARIAIGGDQHGIGAQLTAIGRDEEA